MNNIMHEALQDFRRDFEPSMKVMLSSLTRTTSLIMKAYEHILELPYDEPSDIDEKKLDTAFLADIRHHHDMLLHNVTYELDALRTIGTPRNVERYFNMQNGELVEVDKKEYAGLPDDDEAHVSSYFGADPD